MNRSTKAGVLNTISALSLLAFIIGAVILGIVIIIDFWPRSPVLAIGAGLVLLALAGGAMCLFAGDDE